MIPRIAPGHRSKAGFTLIELLVVIAILLILAAILVPVIARVHQSAQAADTRNQLSSLSSAIKAYFDTFRGYPGPLDDRQMFRARNGAPLPNGVVLGQAQMITQSENLFLGLVGGLSRDPNANQVFNYAPPTVGGVLDLSLEAAGRKVYEPFLKNWSGWITPGRYNPGRSRMEYFFSDGMGTPPGDSEIPEFIDRFSDHPLPILYLRAKAGAPGIVGDASLPGTIDQYQYDVRQFNAYTLPDLYGRVHGLRNVGGWVNPSPVGLNDALPYLRSDTNPGVSNANGNPRVKDTFILISAGLDGIYGTKDDITTFGTVVR